VAFFIDRLWERGDTMKPFTQDEQSAVGHKRYAPRWNMRAHCTCSTNKNSMTYEGHVKDVSCSGACMSTDHDIALNQMVNLTLHLPEKGLVRVNGTAVWSKAVNSHHEIGIHFFNTSPETQEAILQYAMSVNKEVLQDHMFKGWEGR